MSPTNNVSSSQKNKTSQKEYFLIYEERYRSDSRYDKEIKLFVSLIFDQFCHDEMSLT